MKYILFPLALGLLLSCQNTKTEAPKNLDNKQANQTVIEQNFRYFNQHDWEKMASQYSDPAEMKDPEYGIKTVKMTQVEIVKKYKELQQMIPDVHDSVIAMYHADNHITVEFLSSGTAPDGSKFLLPICTIFTLENGKITKDYTYYDNFAGE